MSLSRIARIAARGPIDALHFVTHGTDGAMRLGSTWLTEDTLTAYSSSIAGWRDALAPGADLLIYGCDVAGNAAGHRLKECVQYVELRIRDGTPDRNDGPAFPGTAPPAGHLDGRFGRSIGVVQLGTQLLRERGRVGNPARRIRGQRAPGGQLVRQRQLLLALAARRAAHEVPVRRRGGAGQRVHDRHPRRQHRGAYAHQLPGPRRERLGGPLDGTGPQLLEQAVALPQDAFVLGVRGAVRRTALPQQLVEEPAALGGLAADEREVLGGEQHTGDHTEDIARAGARLAVQPPPVAATSAQLQLDRQPPTALGQPNYGPHDRGVRANPHERRVGRHAVRPPHRQVVHRLEEVGLALGVGSGEDPSPWAQLQRGLPVGAEVDELQPLEVHGPPPARGAPA